MDIFPGENGNEGTYVRLYAGIVDASKDYIGPAGMVLWSGPWVQGSMLPEFHGPRSGRVMAFELIPGQYVSWAKALLVLKPWLNGSILNEVGDCWDVIAKDHVYPGDAYVWPKNNLAPTGLAWPAGLPIPMFNYDTPQGRSGP
jgi:hypothetical protein